MSSISFEPNSLLFGESCLWLFTFFLIPFQLWPEFKNTKTKHVLGGTRLAVGILNNVTQWRLTRIIQLTTVYLITSCQILYAILTIVYGSAAEENYLLFLNKRDPEELSYKCLYYTPLIIRLATSFTLIASYIYRSRYTEWEIFDHFNIFAINSRHQLKIMVFCVLIVTPDCIRLWVDMLFLITFLRSEQYNLLQFTLRSREANLAFLAFAMIINTSSAVFKYKPIVLVIYSEICLTTHLRVLHDKLDIVYNGNSSKSKVDTASTWIAPKRQALQESNDAGPSVHRLHQDMISRQDRPDVYSRSRNSKSIVEDKLKISSSQTNDGQNNNLRARPKIIINQRKPSRAGTITLAQVEECCDGQLAERKEYRIPCLFEFERHLTQLSLFVAAIDQQTPFIVYATLVMNAMSIFYTILFIREIPSKDFNYLYATIFLAGPTLPLYILFRCGQAVEKERDRIATLIEIFHWDNTSSLMVYKQFKSTQHSLKHVFKLLDNIQFNCDNLLGINKAKYWTILSYILGAIFIVLQYDLFLHTNREYALAINGTKLNQTFDQRHRTTSLGNPYEPRIFR